MGPLVAVVVAELIKYVPELIGAGTAAIMGILTHKKYLRRASHNAVKTLPPGLSREKAVKFVTAQVKGSIPGKLASNAARVKAAGKALDTAITNPIIAMKGIK